jgi:hypothetical protein
LKAAITMLTFMYIMSMVDALHALLCILNTWSTECFVFQLIMCCVYCKGNIIPCRTVTP